MKNSNYYRLKYITNEVRDELFGDLDFFDACTIALYTTFVSISLSLALYAFVFYCI